MSSSATEERRSTRIHVQPLVEYAASAPPAEEHQPQPAPPAAEEVGVPLGQLREGSAVLCRDGQAGRVTRVVVHRQQGYPTHMIVRLGRFRPRELRVSCNWVRAVGPDSVELSLSMADLLQQPVYRPDHEIAEAVEEAFHGAEAFHDHADYLAIHATVEDGVVTLHGNVRNSPRRLEAEQIVRGMGGVLAIENCLFADDEIAWKAAWVLERDPRLQIDSLRIETCLGLVRLHGRVGSAAQRERAAAIVRDVPGVHALANGLVVEPTLVPRGEAAPAASDQPVEQLLVR